jgi:DHA2 family multidrug resistance protein
MAADAVNQAIDGLIVGQSVMLATNQMMVLIGVAFVVAASVIWLAPKPTRRRPGAGGH